MKKQERTRKKHVSFLSICSTLCFTDSSLSFVNLIRKRDRVRGGAKAATPQILTN